VCWAGRARRQLRGSLHASPVWCPRARPGCEIAAVFRRVPCHGFVTAHRERTFIAFSCGVLAILSSICFHGDFTRALREVHMKKQSTKSHMPNPCAAAAAGNRALLG
jgi:hypothetical protein